MQRVIRIAVAAGLLLVAVAASACSSSGEQKDSAMKVWGYVVAAKNAKLELAETQPGADGIVVKRVLAPGDAWIVIHADDNGKPGERVGLAHVKRGETADVKVPLTKATTAKVIVAVHADRGTNNKFDFDMMNKEMSPDRPYFVDGKELAKVVTVQ
jgi:hypothetical protein